MRSPVAFSHSASSIPVELVTPWVTVVIPSYNEAATLIEVLERVVAEGTPKEIVIVDDGSTDSTIQRLDEWQADRCPELSPHVSRVVVVRHIQNRGKGAAIRSALAEATAEFLVVQDADLEVSPQEYPDLLKPLQANEADLVVGYRTQVARAFRLFHRLGIVMLNWQVRLLYGVSVRDEACCFKVLKTEDLKRMQLECSRFEFCPEVIAKAARLKLRFAEVPVDYLPRGASGGKKLRLRDGLLAMWTLWKYRRWKPV